MRKLIYILLLLLISTVTYGQIKMKISGIEVANNVEDTTQYADMINIVGRTKPRILLKVQIINIGKSDINLFIDGETYYVDYYYKGKEVYTYQGRKYHIRCQKYNRRLYTDTPIPRGSSYDIILLFEPPNFPQNDFQAAFFEIIPTLKVTMIRDEYRYHKNMAKKIESEKIDWTQITVQPDSPLTNSSSRIGPL